MTAAITIRRRALPLLALAAISAPALADTVDLSVSCDTALAPALRKAAAAYRAQSSVRVFVFPTGPGLILPQLVRDIQNDIVVTQTAILDQAVQAGVVAAAVGAQWRNPLVIAGLQGQSALTGTFAAPDPTPASDIDGPAILARLDIKPAGTLGAVDTDEVAFLLTTGAAQAGVLHMTDVRANARLAVIRPVPADVHAPLLYAASVTRLARRPNPDGFVAFLATKDATDVLTAAGLEIAT
jgi:molybdate transport system substrate-binding protein